MHTDYTDCEMVFFWIMFGRGLVMVYFVDNAGHLLFVVPDGNSHQALEHDTGGCCNVK